MLGQPDLGVAPDHAFVLGPIGLGYDRVNDRLLVQLEELLDADMSDDDDETDDEPADDRAERPRPHPLLRHPRPGRRLLRARRPRRRRRPAAVPVVREPDRSARTRVPAPELSSAAGERARAHRRPGSRRRRRAPRPRPRSPCSGGCATPATPRSSSASTVPTGWRSTSPVAANARCGTSSRGSTAARSPPTCSASRSGSRVVPPTVLRPDAPLGEGSLQWFVNADFSRALLLALRRTPRPPRSAAGDRRVRRHRQQHRPQERALPARDRQRRRRRPRVGDRQRAVLRGRGQAAHRDLGVRRRAAARRSCAGPRRVAADAPAELAGLLDDDEIAAIAPPGPATRRHGDVPRPSGTATATLAAGVSERRVRETDRRA